MAPVATKDLEDYYPADFPADVATIGLEKISVKDLLDRDPQAAERLFHVLRNEGFFYLDLTTDPRGQSFLDQSNQLHRIAKQVFNDVSIEEKEAFKPGNPLKDHLDTGYKSVSKGADGQPDKAEMINISTYGVINDPDNYHLPPWLESHKATYEAFMRTANGIGQIILANLERELHLQPGELTDLHKLSDMSGEFLRMFRYPAPKDGRPHDVPLAPAHTDATSITILFNWQGGLQITRPKDNKGRAVELEDKQRETDEWLYVKPEPGHVIVNLGDPMVVFTNGLLTSGRHQVVTPPGPQALFHRYSVLTNLRPANPTLIQPLKSDLIPLQTEEQRGQKALTALEWSIAKVRAIIERMEKGTA